MAPAEAVGRLVRLDGIRGYLLSMMYLVHFTAMAQSLGSDFFLASYHHSMLLPVFDAEYLVPLSGFVAALAYLGIYRRQGFRATQWAVLRRVRALYLYQVGTALLVLLLPLLIIGSRAMPLDTAGQPILFRLMVQSLTLVVQPDNLQILMLFIGAMLFIPLAILALEGLGPIVFLAIVVDAWFVADAGFDAAASHWITTHVGPWTDYVRISGAFNLLSWGALFYLGFLLGWFYKVRPAVLLEMDRNLMDTLLTASLAVCAFFYVGRVSDFGIDLGDDSLFYPARDLASVQAILTVAATGFVMFYLFVRADGAAVYPRLVTGLDRLFQLRWFVLLGQNSLFIYGAHVVVLAVISTGLRASRPAIEQPLLLALFVAGYAVLLGGAAIKQRYLKMLP